MAPKRRKILLPVLLAVPLTCIVLSCAYILVGHDRLKMYQLGHELSSYPLPPGSELVASTQNVHYPLNSDWCSATASEEIVTSLSEAEVRHYYEQFRYSGIENGPVPFILRPDVEQVSSDGTRNRFTIRISRLYTCLLS